MSRASARALCLVALCAAAVLTAGASIAGGASAPREGCTWHRHAKRVVKHRKMQGRVHTFKRTVHWWTCDPAPAPETTTPPPPTPGGPGETPGAVVGHLSVKAVEWSYTLSRPEVEAGEVIVELNNEGEDSHNLKLQREGGGEPLLAVPEAAAAGRTSARLNLPPGTYHLWCSLPQHEEEGMHATLVVGGG